MYEANFVKKKYVNKIEISDILLINDKKRWYKIENMNKENEKINKIIKSEKLTKKSLFFNGFTI